MEEALTWKAPESVSETHRDLAVRCRHPTLDRPDRRGWYACAVCGEVVVGDESPRGSSDPALFSGEERPERPPPAPPSAPAFVEPAFARKATALYQRLDPRPRGKARAAAFLGCLALAGEPNLVRAADEMGLTERRACKAVEKAAARAGEDAPWSPHKNGGMTLATWASLCVPQTRGCCPRDLAKAVTLARETCGLSPWRAACACLQVADCCGVWRQASHRHAWKGSEARFAPGTGKLRSEYPRVTTALALPLLGRLAVELLKRRLAEKAGVRGRELKKRCDRGFGRPDDPAPEGPWRNGYGFGAVTLHASSEMATRRTPEGEEPISTLERWAEVFSATLYSDRGVCVRMGSELVFSPTQGFYLKHDRNAVRREIWREYFGPLLYTPPKMPLSPGPQPLPFGPALRCDVESSSSSSSSSDSESSSE